MTSISSAKPQARASKRWRDDPGAIAVSMAETLRGQYDGWETVTSRDVEIEDCSGVGGGKAYKLTNRANRTARAAALHILDERFSNARKDPFFFDRQAAAHAIFSQAGISPRRIGEDPDKEWFVEEWAGDDIAEEKPSVELVEEVARLLARTHAIDTAWYDDIRRRQCARYPALADAPQGSHIWWFAAKPYDFLDQFSEKLHRMWIHAGPAPTTEAGSRLVTVHGDVTPRNIVRTEAGLRFIDMEFPCVNYAVYDFCFFLGVTKAYFKPLTDELEEVFTRTYLVECGFPASSEDVSALRLDVERCKMANNFFDMNALWQLVSLRADDDDLGPAYAELVAIADRALVEPDLAEEILKLGFEHCAAVKEVQREEGRPLPGMWVTAHCGTPPRVERSKMQVNWDGTIQSTFERWRGVVLGTDEHGQVVLTNCANTQDRLQLRMDAGRIPTTGLCTPNSAPIPLLLTGQHPGKALVLSDRKGLHVGNCIEYVTLGAPENAVSVHVEADGIVRLADRPLQAFDCAGARTSTGTLVHIFHNHCLDHQKFVLNDDATLSPIGNRDVVWGMGGGGLILVGRHDEEAERLTFCDEFAAAARIEGPGTLAEGDPPACDEGHVLELESHPGLALSVGPYEGRDDVKSLVLVPVVDAERFIVAAEHLCLVEGGAQIALGTPVLPK